MTELIHPSAVIHQDARLGVGVQVGPFCTIGSQVRLGKHLMQIEDPGHHELAG